MAVDAASSSTLQSLPDDAPFAHSSKDASKRKRMNRSAKLKQCKLDARREQWLSRCREEKSATGNPVDDCPREVVDPQRCSRSCKQEALNCGRENRHLQSDSESSLKLEKDNISPKSSEDRSPKNKLSKFGWDFRTSYSGQQGANAGLHDSFKSSQDDWEAAADSLGFNALSSCKENLSCSTSGLAKTCNKTLIYHTQGAAKTSNETLICDPSGMAKTCNETPICDAVGVAKTYDETLTCDTPGVAKTCNRTQTCEPPGMAKTCNKTLSCYLPGVAKIRNKDLIYDPPGMTKTCNKTLTCNLPGVVKTHNKTLICDPPGMVKTCNETPTCDTTGVGKTCIKIITCDNPNVAKTLNKTLTRSKATSCHTLGMAKTCNGTPTCDTPVMVKTCYETLICDTPEVAKTCNETLTCNKTLHGYNNTLVLAETCNGTLTCIKTLTCQPTGAPKTGYNPAAVAHRLKPAGLPIIRSQSPGASNPRHGRAWKLDDAFRPKSLPNLARQCSFLTEPDQGCTPDSLPASCCPICAEDLDSTDQNFLPCPCGFHLCLFCHHRILLDDGRCPGCRKPYKAALGRIRQTR